MRKSANLTAQQKAIYDLEQFADGPICNILGSAIFIDNYPAEKIKEAIREHYRINDALRMRLKDDDGVLSQYVSDYYPEDVKILYFKDIAERDEYAEKWAKEPIDISGQLYEMRGVIFPDKCGLLCKMHHIIGDAWSISLSCTQINKILQGEIPETYSYLDHVASEQKYIESSRYNDDRIFFEECFKKCSQPLFLQDIKSKSCFSANRKTFIINEKEKDIFLEQAKNNHSSLFVLFLTALSIYFSRIKMNADKFFIGSTMLNRSGFAEKNTSGLFINTVPILIELDNSGTFFDNLALVKSSSWSTLRHQKYNYAELLDNLRQNFNFQGKLYDVMINYENAILEGFNNSIWHFNGMQTETLVIQIDDRTRNGILTVSYDYLTEIFTENEIEKVHFAIMRLLDDAIKNPNKKISELEIAPKEELSILNGAEQYLPDTTVHKLFEEQAAINPGKTAVVAADKTLSYKELNEEANRVADFLIRKGVKKGNIIALKLARKSYMLSAIFGILKSGAAYLPIDIDSPRERTAFILADSKAKFCITEENIASVLQGSSVENPKIQTKSDDNFCIIYTSGSTGTPKGAILKHRGIVNFIKNNNVISYFKEKNIEPVGVSVNNVTFDYFIAENIVLLSCGYKTVLASYEESVNADKFGDLCNRNNVNLLQTTPTRFSLFMKSKNPEYFKSFKLLVSSGEPLTHELFARIRRLTDAKVINPLGPSETSVWVLNGEGVEQDNIHLGLPMANTQVYIVDEYMNIVPKGIRGELCIAGESVGAGYLNKPELTAEKFINNPWGEGLLYKTGDIVYLRDDGNIVYVGRKDNQIKLNGLRIELEEIERTLSEIDGIELAAVVVRKNTVENQILCAFYSGEKKEKAEIRNELGKKLPRYMVPHIITHLDVMPLTSSGKINRLSLPEIDLENILEDKEFVEAKNDIEQMVCNKFSEILHISPISMNTDFFLSGGSSIDVLAFLSDERFLCISASEFIANPTPARICAVLESKRSNKYEYLQPLFIPNKSTRTLVLFPYAGGNAESYSELVKKLKKVTPDISIYFVNFLHTHEECRTAAKEIIELSKYSDILFYAHCAGNSVALQLIDFIEEKGGGVERLIVGANIPPEKPFKCNWWNLIPNFIVKRVLIKAGSRIGALSDRQFKEILRLFRKDSDFFTDFFKSRTRKIFSPISVIINRNDIFTRNHKDAVKNWQKYTTGKVSVQYIESDSHYFQSRNADVLAEMIVEIVKK